ncbi:MAG TPA: phospholipid carrier-dependent glycosyltransferase [Actinomycetota bacterium]|nr:phospholipid carrier-dependent glycosyltransferase [Actinomycetota bacterium]
MEIRTEDLTPAPVPAESRKDSPRTGRWYAGAVLVIVAVTAVAGGLRFYHLSTPSSYVFDEVYYAKDGCFDAGYPYRACRLDNPAEQTATVHPPLGRWIIAGGEALFGNRPFGWRFASATFGTISVLLVSVLALLLFESLLWTAVSGLLLATESLNFVQSRVSMLDIFLTTFVLAGYLFLVLDRRWIGRRTPPREESSGPGRDLDLLGLPPDRAPAPVLRPWRILSGLAFGAAFATKWSGAPALAGAILLALAWERTRRRDLGSAHPVVETVRYEAFGIFLFLVLLPIAVYVASFGRYFANTHASFGEWWALQRQMADFSLHLRATHPYASKAWTWLLLKRPVAYYYMGVDAKTSAEILGIGNPAIFWGSILAIPYALISWFRKRDWRAGLIAVAFLIQYIPWFFAARTDFLFYMAPMSPFLVLAVVYGLRAMSRARIGMERVRALAPVAAFVVVASIGLFVFFFPILIGQTISYSAWHARMWFPSWI